MKLFVVVEGQGEEAAVPVLLRRLAAERQLSLEVVGRPWREPRNRILSREHMARVLAVARARAETVLVVLDADDDCAVELAAGVRAIANELQPALEVAVVVAVREFEAWFLAGAESLRERRGLPGDLQRPAMPEAIRDAKGWLSTQRGVRYSPTLDQPALAAVLDFEEAERHSRSFRKLLKEAARLGGMPNGPARRAEAS